MSSRNAPRKATTSSVAAPVPVASSGDNRSYVAPSSSTSTYRVPFNPAGSTAHTQGTVCEFLTTTDTLVGGTTQTAMAAPYRGSAITPGAVALSDSQRIASVSETAAAQNLVVSSIVGCPDNKYWVAYIHTGTQVTIGTKTLVNPNTYVDSEASPTARSSQIILVRYNADNTVDYVYSVPSGSVQQGIAGTAISTRQETQTEVQLAYYAGAGSDPILYMVGNFKGNLYLGNGNNISSSVHGNTLTNPLVFAAGFTIGASTVTCRWATTIASKSVYSAAPAAATHVFPTYSGKTSLGVSTLGDLLFLVNAGATGIDATSDDDTLTYSINANTTAGGHSSFSISPNIDADNLMSFSLVWPIKLYGASGGMDSSFGDGAKPAAPSASGGASTTTITPLACVCHNNDDYSAFAYLVTNGTDTLFYFRDSDDGTLADASDGFGSGSATTLHSSLVAASASIASDVTNRMINIAYATGTKVYLVSYITNTYTTGRIVAVESVRASNRYLFVNSSGSDTGVSGNLTVRKLVTNSVASRSTLSLVVDYASTVTELFLCNGASGSNPASTVGVPYMGSTSEYNSVVFSGTVTTSANSWTAVSSLHFDQSSASTVGNNVVRGVGQIADNRLVLGLGYFSEMSYLDQSGATKVLQPLISGTSVSLTRNSSNALVSILLSTTEGNDRILLLLEKMYTVATGRYEADVIPLLPGQRFRFNSAILIPGQNYYASVSTGALTTTRGSNIFLGVALTTTDLLIGGGPVQA